MDDSGVDDDFLLLLHFLEVKLSIVFRKHIS